jgi:hypothetical protein
MNHFEAMQEAARRAKETGEDIDIWFDADSQALDWRDRYMACRYIDRPAHGHLSCTAHPHGTFSRPSKPDRTQPPRVDATDEAPSRSRRPPRAQAIEHADELPFLDEPNTGSPAVARFAQNCAVLLTRMDAPHVWKFAGVEDDLYDKPSVLQDEDGFEINLKYSTRSKRLIADADFGLLIRHRGRDDSHCHATYDPLRPARQVVADILRRVIEPGRILHARYAAEEQRQKTKIAHAGEMLDQVVTASRGNFEASRNNNSYGNDDFHFYLTPSYSELHINGRISTWSNSITLERVELPLEIMLKLAALIADAIERAGPQDKG